MRLNDIFESIQNRSERLQQAIDDVWKADSMDGIRGVFKSLFTRGDAEDYKSGASEYGSRTANADKRRAINQRALEIAERANRGEPVTEADREIMKQYSGNGGGVGEEGGGIIPMKYYTTDDHIHSWEYAPDISKKKMTSYFE